MNGAAPTLPELIAAALHSRVEQIEVSMPGVVVSYDPETQTATVQPGLRRPLMTIDGERDEEQLKPIQNVPVRFDRAASFSVHYNLQAGDGVHLVFCTRSTNEWRQLSLPGIATPGETRTHSVSSAVCYPGFFPDAMPGPDRDESIGIPGSSNARIHFQPENGILIGGGTKAVALSELVATQLNTLKSAISSAATHVVPNDGGAAIFAALISALSSWPDSMSSSNLSADP